MINSPWCKLVTLPALETRVMIVRRIDAEKIREHLIRHMVEGVTLGIPADLLQVSTLKIWEAAMCARSRDLSKPLQVSWRNYGHGERRIAKLEWAS